MEKSIYILETQFCAYSTEMKEDFGVMKGAHYLNHRHDFLIGLDFAGIAIRLRFIIDLPDSEDLGNISRTVSVTLSDDTLGRELTSAELKVCFDSCTLSRFYYLRFPIESIPFEVCHSYRLHVRDSALDEEICGEAFSLYDIRVLGDPSSWYKAVCGGIVNRGDRMFEYPYKAIVAEPNEGYDPCFTVEPLLADIPQKELLPELEIRVYSPDNQGIDIYFAKPSEYNSSKGVFYLMGSVRDLEIYTGIFYAELLCMGRPIAGFVFESKPDYWENRSVEGAFFGKELQPMENYTAEVARERYFNEGGR